MAYPDQYNAFAEDKQRFFSLTRKPSIRSAAESKRRAYSKDYRFLITNLTLIEQEFNLLYASLQKPDEELKTHWLYCYYCSQLLVSYYKTYDKPDKLKHYQTLAKKIRYRIKNKVLIDELNDERSIYQKMSSDFRKLAHTPQHLSQLRDWVGFSNMLRIQLVFSRLTVTQSLVLANEMNWLSKLGLHSDVASMVSGLESTVPIFNFLSVGFFATRITMNLSMILKHTFSTAEAGLPRGERFQHEMSKRHAALINDLAWGTINGITNYASRIGLAAPVANWILGGFLIFDVGMLIYSRNLEMKAYLLKRAELMDEKNIYDKKIKEALTASQLDELKLLEPHAQIIQVQLTKLENDWQTTSATYWFNVAAAVIFMVSFSAALLLASSVSAPICFFIGTVAMAMYLSSDQFKLYHQQSMLFENTVTGDHLGKVKGDLDKAREAFFVALIKNTFVPIILITTLAFSWPAAILLTALYISYECTKGYFNNTHQPELLPPLPPADNGHGFAADEPAPAGNFLP